MTTTDDEVLTKPGVAKLLKCSVRTVDAMINDGKIPKPTYLGTKSPRWRKSQILNVFSVPEGGAK